MREDNRTFAELRAEIGRLRKHLQAIINDAPKTEPERDEEVGFDEVWARSHQHWRLAKIARAALAKAREGAT